MDGKYPIRIVHCIQPLRQRASTFHMGACVSSGLTAQSVRGGPTARVVALDGSLQLLPTPATTSDVLPPGSPTILCSSETLYHGAHIPSLDADHELKPGHIYFVLPKSMLGYPLTQLDMADLAVKASCALASAMNRSHSYRQRRKINATVVPMAADGVDESEVDGIRRLDKVSWGGGGDVPSFKIVLRGDDHGNWRKTRSLLMRKRAGGPGSRRRHGQRLSIIVEVDE